jgi:hypothetical protein
MTTDREPSRSHDDDAVTPAPVHLPEPLALVIPEDEVTQPLPLTSTDRGRSSTGATRVRRP